MFTFACGSPYRGHQPKFSLYGEQANLGLKLGRFALLLHLLPLLWRDLVDIAVYLYSIDYQLSFQKLSTCCHVIIPVRDPDLWNSLPIQELLLKQLSILSPHHYQFTFTHFHDPPPDIRQTECRAIVPDNNHIAIYDGGIDSLAGIVHNYQNNKPYTLLGIYHSHHEYNAQQHLYAKLSQSYPCLRMVSIGVQTPFITSKKSGNLQAFLYAILGAAIAYAFGQRQFTVYENAVQSHYSHITQQKLSGSIMPLIFIPLFQRFISQLCQEDIKVNVPFAFKTPEELVQHIDKTGYASYITHTYNCQSSTDAKTYCGICPSCLQSFMACSTMQHMPYIFQHQPLTDNWTDEQALADAKYYLTTISAMHSMSRIQYVQAYPNIHKYALHVQENIFASLKRHASHIHHMVVHFIQRYAKHIYEGKMSPRSLLYFMIMRHAYSAIEEDIKQDVATNMFAQYELPHDTFCEFAIDQEHKVIVITGGVKLVGAEYRLILLLLPSFTTSKNTSAPVTPLRTNVLAHKIYNGDEVKTRKLISRINHKVEYATGLTSDTQKQESIFIENIRGQGYYINPNTRLLGTYGELL